MPQKGSNYSEEKAPVTPTPPAKAPTSGSNVGPPDSKPEYGEPSTGHFDPDIPEPSHWNDDLV
jgi:hypothetical protein